MCFFSNHSLLFYHPWCNWIFKWQHKQILQRIYKKINNMNFNFKVFAVSPCLKIHSTVIMFWPHQRYSLICLQLDNIPKMQISQRVPVTTFTKIILLLIAWHTQSYLKLICNTPLMSSTRNNCFIALLSLSSLPL